MNAPLAKPDIVATIENEGVALRRRGRNLWAPCPFHQEKTPSFKVSVDKQLFYCFSCGQGGDVITFIMLHRNLSFKDAMGYLRLDAGAGTGDPRTVNPVETKKRHLIETFRKWERDRYRELCRQRLIYVGMTRDLATIEEVEERASLIHELPAIEHELDVLWHGTDEEKFELWKSLTGASDGK